MAVPTRNWRVSQAWGDRDAYRCGKLFRVLRPRDAMCEITGVIAAKSVMLVGDSHADALKWSFAQVAKQAGVGVRFVVDNTPLLPGGMSLETLLAEASRRAARGIVLHYSEHTLSAATLHKIAEFAEPRGIRVAVLMPVPVWSNSDPAMLTRHLETQAALPQQTLGDYRSLHAPWRAAIEAVAPTRIYDVADLLCRPDCALWAADGRPLYFDSHHLTLTGSDLLRPVFQRVLADLTAQPLE